MAQQIQLGISADIPQIKPAKKFRSKYQKWKYEANYRKAEDNKCCKTCKNCIGFWNGNYDNAKYYYKCNLQGLSHSAATDIRVSYVCDYYKEGNND